MKKNNFIYTLVTCFILLCNLQEAICQATSGNFGNIPQAAGEYLGWTSGTNQSLEINNQDAYPINLSTNNAQRITILGSGNTGYVGIGQGSPTSVLHVDGTGTPTTTGEVFRTNGKAGASTYWRMFRDVSGTPTEYGTIYNNNDNHFYVEAPNGAGDVRFQSGGANTRMTVASGGNVGIGTTSPSNLLHVYNSSTSGAVYGQFSNGNASNTLGLWVGIDGSNDGIVKMRDHKPLRFYTNDVQYMYMSSAGDIGIGTNFNNPSSRLHQFVSGANDNWHYIENGSGGAGFNFLRLGITSNTAELNIQSNWPMNFFTNNTQRATILGNGKVGIGITSPASLFHVDGGEMQLTNSSTSPTAGDGFLVKLSGSTVELKQQENDDMKFYTNGSQAAVIKSSGRVGIGTNNPDQQLHVLGDVNVSDASGWVGYDIGNQRFFTAPGGGTSLAVGFDAASEIIANQYANSYNTFVGNSAGHDDNTSNSGNGNNNTFIGASAGSINDDGNLNTCLGYAAGADNVSGDNNVYLGQSAGRDNDGDNNTMVGVNAGSGSASTGNYNSIFGFNAGYANTGSQNTLIGYNTLASAGLTNATALGANASVAASNCLVLGSGANVGIATSSPTHTFQLGNDDAAKTTTSTWTVTSDMRLKTDTSLFTDGLNLVRQVHPVNYKYKAITGLDPVTNNIGIIAQEIQGLAPYVIRDSYMKLDTNDANATQVLGVNMHAFWFILINAVKELDAGNQALMSRIDQLETQVNNMNGSRHRNPDDGSKTSIDVELSNTKSIILDQNVPNPFADQTTINYFLPEDVGKAQIIFYNNNGVVMRIVDVNEKGQGELNVFAPDLSSGIYTYTLIADGKVIETKKMVKQ